MSGLTKADTPPIFKAEVPASTRMRSLWGDAWRRLFKNRLAVFGLIIVLIFISTALFGRALAPYDFLEQDISNALQSPSMEHWLGTDALGRDIFSRLVYGARTAALVAFTTTAISLMLGILLGTASGFLQGRVDELIMWLTDVTMSVPGLLLAMLVNTALKRPISAWFNQMYEVTRNPVYLNTLWLDFFLVFGALAFISWPGYARLIRGQVLSISRTTYVEAARSVGSNLRRIMFRHIVPNALGPLVVAVTAGMGGAVVLESTLSFLGVGVQPPNASWGSMLSDSLSLWRVYPHLMLAPAITIGTITLAFTFLGDGLNDALNPRRTND
jgi:ABC-type dipeptide/oligopeptide/nickel transport system permease subunit